MSNDKVEKKVEPKKPSLGDMKKELNQLKHELDSLPRKHDVLLESLEAKKRTDLQDLQASRSRLIKPAADAKQEALAVARKEFDNVARQAEDFYKEEILPARQRRDAKLFEANKKLLAKIEAAREKFNEKSNNLVEEHKIEIKKTEKKHVEALAELEGQTEARKDELLASIQKKEKEIAELEKKLEAKAKKKQPAVEKTA